jgi:hypothetical protein
MRKFMSLMFVILLGFGGLTACSSNGDAAAEGCKNAGGSEEACKCVKTRVDKEMTDDEVKAAVKANPDKDADAKFTAILQECMSGSTGDGTGGDGTNTGS